MCLLFFQSSLELPVQLGQDWGWGLEDSEVVVEVEIGVVLVHLCIVFGAG